MSLPKRGEFWKAAFFRSSERMRETLWWAPYPCLISFGLVLVLVGHLVPNLNPRLGNPADILKFATKQAPSGEIWLSLSPVGEEIVATTALRKTFRWPLVVKSHEEIAELTDYLKARIESETFTAALAEESYPSKTRVIIAADQRLKFLHIRPVLYALAAANITNYSFETLYPEFAAGSDSVQDHHERQEIH